eukprot:3841182-Alexandrium_andersonii.AAC.1
MDCRARKHPAKSASTYTRGGAPSPCHGKWQTHRERTIRYRVSLLSAAQSVVAGFAILWQIFLAENP